MAGWFVIPQWFLTDGAVAQVIGLAVRERAGAGSESSGEVFVNSPERAGTLGHDRTGAAFAVQPIIKEYT